MRPLVVFCSVLLIGSLILGISDAIQDSCCPDHPEFNCICNDNYPTLSTTFDRVCPQPAGSDGCPASFSCQSEFELAGSGNLTDGFCCQDCGNCITIGTDNYCNQSAYPNDGTVPYTWADNVCVDFLTDKGHCGFCGNRCVQEGDVYQAATIVTSNWCVAIKPFEPVCCESCGFPQNLPTAVVGLFPGNSSIPAVDGWSQGCPLPWDPRACGSTSPEKCNLQCDSDKNATLLRIWPLLTNPIAEKVRTPLIPPTPSVMYPTIISGGVSVDLTADLYHLADSLGKAKAGKTWADNTWNPEFEGWFGCDGQNCCAVCQRVTEANHTKNNCVDLFEDDNNCGFCANRCAQEYPGYSCVRGRCCQDCGENECIETDTDPHHCGSCFNRCGFGQECRGGVCRDVCEERCEVCVARYTDGGACYVNTQWRAGTPSWCLGCCDRCCDKSIRQCQQNIKFGTASNQGAEADPENDQ